VIGRPDIFYQWRQATTPGEVRWRVMPRGQLSPACVVTESTPHYGIIQDPPAALKAVAKLAITAFIVRGTVCGEQTRQRRHDNA
jgi:hypothetical protein